MRNPTNLPIHSSTAGLVLALAAGLAPPLDNPAATPQARPGAWLELHESFAATAGLGDVDLLFLGDALTASWPATSPASWERHFAPRGAANFAIGGDRTQNLLWRLDHGELEGIKPRVVVLMIGGNNLPDDPEADLVAAIRAILDRLAMKLPASKVLLLGLTPRAHDRDPGRSTAPADPRVARLNRRLAGLADGRGVRYLDLGPALLDDQGRLTRANQPDFFHLSRKGYQAWADAMEPTLWRMMEGD